MNEFIKFLCYLGQFIFILACCIILAAVSFLVADFILNYLENK